MNLPNKPIFEGGSERAQVLGIDLPTGTDPASVRARVEAAELLLERSFRIPGVNVPIGLDAIIGLVPVVGDIITTCLLYTSPSPRDA